MPKYPRFKYEFEINGEVFFLAVGESKISAHGVKVKVCRYDNGEIMKTLWIQFDDGKWHDLENGYRTIGGRLFQNFKRFEVHHSSVYQNGIKTNEQY